MFAKAPPTQRAVHGSSAGARRIGLRPILLLCLVGLFALTALAIAAGPASAHHLIPGCPTSGYTRVWTTPQNFTSGVWPMVNECILVQADVNLESGAEVRMRDSALVFDNDLGNFTLNIAAGAVFEIRDQDGVGSTTVDRSLVTELNESNNLTSFFFNVTPGSAVYFNDTDIVGGGLADYDFSFMGGFVFSDMLDFGWNRVNHTTLGHGFVLINWTRPLTIPNYNLSGKLGFLPFGYGIVLQGCRFVTVLDYLVGPAPGTVGTLVNDSDQVSFRRTTLQTVDAGMVFHRATNVTIDNLGSTQHTSAGIYLESVKHADLTLLRLKPGSSSTYGLRVAQSQNVTARNADIWSDSSADVFLEGDSRDFLLENATLRLGAGGFGVDALSTGAGLFTNNLTFRNVAITGKGAALLGAVRIRQQGGVLFDNVTILQSPGLGLILDQSADVRFFGGSISQNSGGAVSTSAANLTFLRTNITFNPGGGVLVTGGSIVVERSTVTGNGGWSLRSQGLITMVGTTALLNSTLEGDNPNDAVNLTLTSGSSGTLFRAYNSTFVRPGTAAAVVFGVYVAGFDRVEVENCTFSSQTIAVLRSNIASLRNVTATQTYLQPFAVAVLVEQAGAVTIDNVREGPAPALQGKVAVAFRVSGATISVDMANLSFVRADFGFWVNGTGGALRATLRNVTGAADQDLCTFLGMQSLDATLVSGTAGQTGFVATAGGFITTIALHDLSLQAARVGVQVTSDALGAVALDNISFGSARPPLGFSIANAATALLSRLATDGLANGTVTNDVRRVFVSQMNFRDNVFGLRMVTPASNATQLNWTITQDAELSNTTLLVDGEVTVDGASFTLRRGANLTFFATQPAPAPSRIYFLGAALLSVTESSRIAAAPRDNETLGSVAARFTLQFSAQTRLVLRDAALIGLGDPAALAPEQRGIYLRAQDVAVSNVTFLLALRPLQGLGVSITVDNSSFSGLAGSGQAALTVTNGSGTLRGPGTTVSALDAVECHGGSALIENVSVIGAGAALVASNCDGAIVDSSVEASTSVVYAEGASEVTVLRAHASFMYAAVNATAGAHVFVNDSFLAYLANDTIASGGALVEFYDTLVDRHDDITGYLRYEANTSGGGTFRVFWHVLFQVCRLSGGFVAGAQLQVRDLYGTVIYAGTTTSAGVGGPVTVMQYQSQNGASAYFTPINVSATFGALTNSTSVPILDGSAVVLCLDDLPPDFIITSPKVQSPPPTAESFVLFEGRAFDNQSGLQRGYPCISVDNGTCAPVPPVFAFQMSLHEGVNFFRLTARDGFGNEAHRDFYVVRDSIDPWLVECDPPAGSKVGAARVALACQFSPDTVNASIAGVPTEGAALFDSNQTLHATVILREGVNSVQFSFRDGAVNINISGISLTLDTTPPTVTFTSRHNQTINVSALFLSGQVSSDTAYIEFNGVPVNFSGSTFSVRWDLGEGHNEGTLVLRDDVGNEATYSVYLDSDTQTHCVLYSPKDGERVGAESVVFGGACDTDVTILIEGAGVAQTATPREDGKWSVSVPLRRGDNALTVRGTDANGATWEETVTVISSPTNQGGDPLVFIVLLAVAAGIFVAAFIIMRQPRRREPEEPARPATGAQKAPPRPKAAVQDLPEVPTDQVYRPRPPTGPPGGR